MDGTNFSGRLDVAGPLSWCCQRKGVSGSVYVARLLPPPLPDSGSGPCSAPTWPQRAAQWGQRLGTYPNDGVWTVVALARGNVKQMVCVKRFFNNVYTFCLLFSNYVRTQRWSMDGGGAS